MDVDSSCAADIFDPPYFAEEVFAGEDFPLVHDKKTEKLEFLVGQIELLIVHVDTVLFEIDDQASDGY